VLSSLKLSRNPFSTGVTVCLSAFQGWSTPIYDTSNVELSIDEYVSCAEIWWLQIERSLSGRDERDQSEQKHRHGDVVYSIAEAFCLHAKGDEVVPKVDYCAVIKG